MWQMKILNLKFQAQSGNHNQNTVNSKISVFQISILNENSAEHASEGC